MCVYMQQQTFLSLKKLVCWPTCILHATNCCYLQNHIFCCVLFCFFFGHGLDSWMWNVFNTFYTISRPLLLSLRVFMSSCFWGLCRHLLWIRKSFCYFFYGALWKLCLITIIISSFIASSTIQTRESMIKTWFFQRLWLPSSFFVVCHLLAFY